MSPPLPAVDADPDEHGMKGSSMSESSRRWCCRKRSSESALDNVPELDHGTLFSPLFGALPPPQAKKMLAPSERDFRWLGTKVDLVAWAEEEPLPGKACKKRCFFIYYRRGPFRPRSFEVLRWRPNYFGAHSFDRFYLNSRLEPFLKMMLF